MLKVDGLFNDCHGRDRLNDVVADTAFQDLPAREPQRFDFGSLKRSKSKTDIGGFNLVQTERRFPRETKGRHRADGDCRL